MGLIPLGSFSNVSVCSYMVEGEGDDRRGGGGIRCIMLHYHPGAVKSIPPIVPIDDLYVH